MIIVCGIWNMDYIFKCEKWTTEQCIEYQHLNYMWLIHAPRQVALLSRYFSTHYFLSRSRTSFFTHLKNNMHNSCKEHAQQPSNYPSHRLLPHISSFIQTFFFCQYKTIEFNINLLARMSFSNMQLPISTLCSIFIIAVLPSHLSTQKYVHRRPRIRNLKCVELHQANVEISSTTKKCIIFIAKLKMRHCIRYFYFTQFSV